MNELINENLTDFELLSDDIKNTEKLYERFLGYADTYDEGRPKLPSKAIELLKIYLDNDIKLIQELLGYSTVEVIKIYTHLYDKDVEKALFEHLLSKFKYNDALAYVAA